MKKNIDETVVTTIRWKLLIWLIGITMMLWINGVNSRSVKWTCTPNLHWKQTAPKTIHLCEKKEMFDCNINQSKWNEIPPPPPIFSSFVILFISSFFSINRISSLYLEFFPQISISIVSFHSSCLQYSFNILINNLINNYGNNHQQSRNRQIFQ